MARVDYQQVVERLLVLAASKPNHGQRDLLRSIGRFIEDATVHDDQYGAFLARFGEEVQEAVLDVLPTADHAGIPTLAASTVTTSGSDQPSTAPDGHGGSWTPTPRRLSRRPIPA